MSANDLMTVICMGLLWWLVVYPRLLQERVWTRMLGMGLKPTSVSVSTMRECGWHNAIVWYNDPELGERCIRFRCTIFRCEVVR